MTMIFNVLYTVHLFVTALLGLSLVSIIVQSVKNSMPLKMNEFWPNVLFLLFFAATSFAVYALKNQGRQPLATTILGVIWLLVLVAIIYAISKARWN